MIRSSDEGDDQYRSQHQLQHHQYQHPHPLPHPLPHPHQQHQQHPQQGQSLSPQPPPPPPTITTTTATTATTATTIQPGLHQGQQAVYAGRPSHGQQQQQQQQQVYPGPQAGQQGFYVHPQQFHQHQARHQQHQQHRQPLPPPIMTYNNSYNFNMYQSFDAGAHGGTLQMQSAANRYMPPMNVWQQPVMQQQPVQPPPLPPPPQQQQPMSIQPAQQQQHHHHQQSPHPHETYYSHAPSASIQPRPSPIPQPARQPLQPSIRSPSQQQQQQQQQQRQQQRQQQQQAPETPQPSQTQSQPIAQPPENNNQTPSTGTSFRPPNVQPPPQEEPVQQQYDFVNLQDIQKQPLLPALPVMTKKRTISDHAEGQPTDKPSAAKQPRLETTHHVKQEEDNAASARIPPHVPETRVKYSPHSSVTNSPALSTRSPSIAKRSPAIPPKPRPVNTTPLMVAIAEECLEKARAASHDVAMTMSADRVDDYQKLIATSLSCLEAALQSNQLPPREEARVRLRYAAVLQEETENLMEAETALGKGITLCDKHRLYDLKYCMQYLMLKVLFQRNHKAALKAVDGHISNCEAFKHIQWFYAFRLLKASFYFEMGTMADVGVLDNVRSIQSVASARGDNAISVLASLLEGFTLLKTTKDGSMERIQACIAQVAKYQFDPTVQQIVQLTVLTLLLEVTASLHHQSPDHTAQKLRLLQKTLDECDGWNNVKSVFLVPVKKQPSTAKTVSEDTQMVVQPGEGEGEVDHVVMTFMTKMELKSLVFTISGLANFHKPSGRSTEFWTEGLRILDTWDRSTAGIPYGQAVPLNVAMKQRAWRIEAQAYLNILLGLVAASHCQWGHVKATMQKLGILVSQSTQSTVRLLSTYLEGVYYQGVGDLAMAMRIFKDPCFAVPRQGAGTKAGQQEIALLAGLNRLWIMQHHSYLNDEETLGLIEELQPQCANHWNLDLRTAWHNVMAALVTDPPQQLNQQKQHMHAAMAGSKMTSNVLGAAVTLCIMRSRFFENVIGEQALKSARAAAKQAQRSGNMLWQSVADGMLAQSYEVQGQREEAKQEWDKATRETRNAFSRSL
ncbi:hypothetical protein ESCO_000389 [Escovopsis weberi]|uniref:MAU2 chromatid cohesion factor-like protein n=1 Tax=Escovopsis weberi TaxID=150374 RepID=A0A0M9VTB8_ESCWE|nr:hypothetical protein ESCO_000389 [Escovopsis weberi]